MVYILLALVILMGWTLWGIWHFLRRMGDKSHKDTWYDYVLGAPVLLIIYIMERMEKR